MATWQPKEQLIDITNILLKRTKEPGFDGDVYASFKTDLEDSIDELKIVDALTENITLPSGKKNIFSETITEQEKEFIGQRVTQQQKEFQDYERKAFHLNSKRIRLLYVFLTDQEIKEILKDSDNNEDYAISQLSSITYLSKIREAIAKAEMAKSEASMSLEQQQAYESLIKKRNLNQRKGAAKRTLSNHTVGRLPLDQALKQAKEDPKAAFAGWSAARIKAYDKIKENPNAYYYRFNAPGEEQRTGQWTVSERKLFFDRVKEIGTDGQWGIFSMKIPGRVGYQCSNFYRQLIQKKEIVDPKYIVEPNGKLHYLFATKQKDLNGDFKKSIRTHNRIHKGKKGKNKSKRYSDDTTDESEQSFSSEEEDVYSTPRKRTTAANRSRQQAEQAQTQEDLPAPMPYAPVPTDLNQQSDDDDYETDFENPLPGFIDPITLDEVVQPAISPYGHVMGYANWVRCLNSGDGKQRNVCPLTKQPLTKRDLIILTYENIEQYKDKIVSL